MQRDRNTEGESSKTLRLILCSPLISAVNFKEIQQLKFKILKVSFWIMKVVVMGKFWVDGGAKQWSGGHQKYLESSSEDHEH